MKSQRQQRLANRRRLRKLVSDAGVGAIELARLTEVPEERWREWLRGDAPVPLKWVDCLDGLFSGLTGAGIRQRIDVVEELRRAQSDPNIVGTTAYFIPRDPAERAALRRRIETGQARTGSLSGKVQRPLNETERRTLLRELERPYQPTAVDAH